MEASMFLAPRTRTALLAAATMIAARSGVAAESAPTKAECIAASESGQDLRHAGKLGDARAAVRGLRGGELPRTDPR